MPQFRGSVALVVMLKSKAICDCVVWHQASPSENSSPSLWRLPLWRGRCRTSWSKRTEETTHSPNERKPKKGTKEVPLLFYKRKVCVCMCVCTLQYIQNVFKLYRSTQGIHERFFGDETKVQRSQGNGANERKQSSSSLCSLKDNLTCMPG